MDESQTTGVARRRLLKGLAFAVLGGVTAGMARLLPRPAGEDVATDSALASEPTPTTRIVRLVTPDPPTSTTASSSSTTTTTEPTLRVDVICREAWGASESGSGFEEHQPVRLTIHHTAVEQTTDSQGPARARQHQTFHLSRGWPDLAYHFLVDRVGAIYQGRDLRYRGDTGTEYDPTGHFLVCLEGDFNIQPPTEIQIEQASLLFAWASQTFTIDPETLAGHSTYADTTCPGSEVVSILASGSMLDTIAGSPTIELVDLCGDDALSVVAAIESG